VEEAVPEEPPAEPRSESLDAGPGFLLALGLLWLGTRLWSAHANIRDSGAGVGRIIVAAYQLPDVMAASALAGAACGVAAVAWRVTRRPDGGAWGRRLVGALAGLATGLLVAAVVIIGYGSHSPDLVIALSVMAACTLGGALVAFPPVRIMAAGVSATL